MPLSETMAPKIPLGFLLPSLASSSSVTQLQIGIVGAGIRGIQCFGRLLCERTDVRLVALADANRERMEGAEQILGQPLNCYGSAEEMYRAERLDGVVITLPDYLHADAVIKALKAGVPHVMVDKPLATTTADCLRVIETMQMTGGKVAMGFNARHRPIVSRIKELIEDGVVGELMMLENREFYDGGRTYMARWNRKYAWSGGLWVHKGTHDFDIFNWWNAKGTPTRVAASAGLNALRPDKIPFQVEPDKPVGPTCSTCAYRESCPDVSPQAMGSELFNDKTVQQDGYTPDLCIFLSDKDVHDNGISLVEYDNNVRASHLECFVCGFSTRIFTVVGDRGVLMADLLKPGEIEFRPRWGKTRLIDVPPAPEGQHGGADPLLVSDWIESLHGGRSSSANVRDGLRAVAIGQAAEIASRERRSVEISELVDWTNPLLKLPVSEKLAI